MILVILANFIRTSKIFLNSRKNWKSIGHISRTFTESRGIKIFLKSVGPWWPRLRKVQIHEFSQKPPFLKIKKKISAKIFDSIKCSVSRAIFLKKRFCKKLLYNSRNCIFSEFGRRIFKIPHFTKNSNFWLKKMNF